MMRIAASKRMSVAHELLASTDFDDSLRAETVLEYCFLSAVLNQCCFFAQLSCLTLQHLIKHVTDSYRLLVFAFCTYFMLGMRGLFVWN